MEELFGSMVHTYFWKNDALSEDNNVGTFGLWVGFDNQLWHDLSNPQNKAPELQSLEAINWTIGGDSQAIIRMHSIWLV